MFIGKFYLKNVLKKSLYMTSKLVRNISAGCFKGLKF